MGSAFLLAALLFEGYLLVRDVPLVNSDRMVSQPAGEPIAELVRRTAEVRLQDPGHLEWDEVKTGQTLYRRQSLITQDGARAEIAFLDGSGLVLDENTLIQVERNGAATGTETAPIVVTLLRGTIRKTPAKVGSPAPRRLEVRVGQTRAEFTSSSAAIVSSSPANQEATIRVQAGEATVIQGNRTSRVGAGEEVTAAINSSPSIVARKLAFQPLRPLAGDTVRSAEAMTKVSFQWEVDVVQCPDCPQELQASKDADFSGTIHKLRINATTPPLKQVSATLTLNSTSKQKWYWRIYDIKNRSFSRTEQFTLDPIARPVPLLPLGGATASRTRPVDFSWSEVPLTTKYELEVSDSNSSATHKVSSALPYYRLESLTVGQNRWRVRALQSDQSYSAWSEWQGFMVIAESQPKTETRLKNEPEAKTEQEPLPPPPPDELMDAEVLPKRAPAPTHSWLERLFPSAWAEEKSSYEIRVKWKTVPGALKYRIQIGRQRTFNTLVAEAETNANEWIWHYERGMENTKGRVFYRVASVDSRGRQGAFSKPKAIPIPKLLEVYSAQDPEGEDAQPDNLNEGPQLSELAAEPPVPAKSAIPRVTPKPAAVDLPAPSPSPKSTPTILQATVPEKVRPKPIETPSVPWNFYLLAGPGISAAGSHQKTEDDDLAEVSIKSPYLAQIAFLRLIMERPGNSKIEFEGDMQLAKFSRSTSSPFDQPSQNGLSASGWVTFHPHSAASLRLGFGAVVSRDYHWEKSSATSVTLKSGTSLGPALSLDWAVLRGRLTIGAPLTGLATQGSAGVLGKLQLRFSLTSIGAAQVSVSPQAEYSYLHWKSPKQTTAQGWSAGATLLVGLPLSKAEAAKP